MNNFEIRTWTSYGDTALVEIILNSPGVEVYEVELNIKGQTPWEETPSEKWPLIIRCTSDNPEARKFEIRVFDFTSGYGGQGPSDLVKCLKATGLEFDEDEIYTSKRIQRKYTR